MFGIIAWLTGKFNDWILSIMLAVAISGLIIEYERSDKDRAKNGNKVLATVVSG